MSTKNNEDNSELWLYKTEIEKLINVSRQGAEKALERAGKSNDREWQNSLLRMLQNLQVYEQELKKPEYSRESLERIDALIHEYRDELLEEPLKETLGTQSELVLSTNPAVNSKSLQKESTCILDEILACEERLPQETKLGRNKPIIRKHADIFETLIKQYKMTSELFSICASEYLKDNEAQTCLKTCWNFYQEIQLLFVTFKNHFGQENYHDKILEELFSPLAVIKHLEVLTILGQAFYNILIRSSDLELAKDSLKELDCSNDTILWQLERIKRSKDKTSKSAIFDAKKRTNEFLFKLKIINTKFKICPTV